MPRPCASGSTASMRPGPSHASSGPARNVCATNVHALVHRSIVANSSVRASRVATSAFVIDACSRYMNVAAVAVHST